jgi:seryl-tRNA synthetase
MATANTVVEVLDFVAGHLSILGWPLLIGLVWKTRGVIDDYLKEQRDAAEQVTKTFESVEAAKKLALESVKAATEHGAQKAQELITRVDANQKRLEETAAAVRKIDENDLAHLTSDLKSKWTEQGESSRDILKVLQSIDTNIQVMAAVASPRRRVSK